MSLPMFPGVEISPGVASVPGRSWIPAGGVALCLAGGMPPARAAMAATQGSIDGPLIALLLLAVPALALALTLLRRQRERRAQEADIERQRLLIGRLREQRTRSRRQMDRLRRGARRFIVQRDSARRALRDQQRLTEALRAEIGDDRELLAMLSHELRAPARTILDALQSRERDPDTGLVERSARHILLLLDNLMSWSGGARNAPTACDLVEVCRDAIVSAGAPASEPVLAVLDVAPGLPRRWRLDGAGVRQIVTNLVANALRHTDSGHVIVSIDAVDDGESGLRLAVSDTGEGIAPEFAEQVFRPFLRGGDPGVNRGRPGSAGLGLAVVRRIAEESGGSASVDTRRERGARLVVDLPRARPLEEQAPAPPDPASILVVESDPVVRGIILGHLQHWGLSCAEAPSVPMRLADPRTPPTDFVILGPSVPEGVAPADLPAGRRIDLARAPSPLSLLDPEALRLRLRRAGIQGSSQTLPVPLVLAADDHPVARRALEDAIRGAGGEPLIVDSGELARRRLEDLARPPDWILLDREMPGMDGLVTATALRRALPGAGTRLVLLVNHPGEAPAAAEQLFDLVLIRPSGRRELTERLRVLFAGAMDPPDTEPTPALPASGSRSGAALDRLLHDTLREDLIKLRGALAGGDPEAVRALTHRMRGALRFRPDPVLQRHLDALTTTLANHDARRSRLTIEAFISALDRSPPEPGDQSVS